MTIAQAAPWLLDALTLWLTADQEIELRDIQELLKRGAAGAPGAIAPPGGEPAIAAGEGFIGSGEWIEEQEWLELERAARDNWPCDACGRRHCHCED